MNPILLDFPHEFYSERLLIRLPQPGDGKLVHSAITESMKELKPWLPFAQKEQTVEEVEANIRDAHIKFLKREDLRFHIFHKETGEVIGCSGLHRIDWDVPKFEIGYWVNSRFSGRGYITEAVRRISDFAFDDLKARRVEIRCDATNTRSRAVAERLGYQLDAILKNEDVSVDGKELRDTCIFSKVK
ncbi:RimJ/RimL family protein N-acetyltransferase [Evansella vedderi]|uniref:RimJ/RimL family protein N-acetyltransferase n=1 Tax=Evansella vedderi TaxID=38282 RepID=A0ABU0A169_9BACI|nr:GNAT family N-acetyltransferase [Evansella vedderi]MDQ0256869.1 RimJ/RimL family protein N-acetyltransferase [Evansella vedderi]